MKETVNSPLKAYFKKIFSKKQLITKAIILAAAAILVIIPAVCFYACWSGISEGTQVYQGGMISIKIIWNSGIAASAMSGNYAGIYAIQSVVFVVLLAAFVFLTQDKVSCSFVALAIFGGLFNLIQRACAPAAHANCVFDYFNFIPALQWMSLGDTVFNWPDVGVVVGIIGFVISYIAHVIIQVVKEKKANKELENKSKDYEKTKTGKSSK